MSKVEVGILPELEDNVQNMAFRISVDEDVVYVTCVFYFNSSLLEEM